MPAPSRDERRSHHSFVLIGVASAVAVVAALVLIVVAHSDGPAELPVDRIVTEVAPAEGPGSNSLNLTAPDASVTDAQHTDVSLSRAAEGPGSNSLNVTEP